MACSSVCSTDLGQKKKRGDGLSAFHRRSFAREVGKYLCSSKSTHYPNFIHWVSQRKFSIDVQSSTGVNPVTNVGTPPLAAGQITYSQPSRPGRSFARQRLETWIDGITWPRYRSLSAEAADL
jgi:hypothetical protein